MRESYLKRMRPFYHEKLIKVIVGVRRNAAKSVLLNQICDDLKESGVKDGSITLVNFELYANKPLRNADALHEFILSRMRDGEMHYIFLDEVQRVDGFEDVVKPASGRGQRKRVHHGFEFEAAGRGDGDLVERPLCFVSDYAIQFQRVSRWTGRRGNRGSDIRIAILTLMRHRTRGLARIRHGVASRRSANRTTMMPVR